MRALFALERPPPTRCRGAGHRCSAAVAIARGLCASVVCLVLSACEQQGEAAFDLHTIDAAKGGVQVAQEAENHFMRGSYRQAADGYREALQLLPSADYGATVAAFLSLADSGRYTAMLATLHNNLGLSHYRLRQFESAAVEFEAALSLNPRHLKALSNLALVRMRQKRYDAAAELYRLLARRRALDTEEQIWAAEAALVQGQTEEARRHLSYALRDRRAEDFIGIGNMTRAHYQCGRVLQTQDDIDGAIQHFEAALALSPGNVQARYQLARSLAREGQSEAAASAKAHFEKDARLLAMVQGLLDNAAGNRETQWRIATTYEHLGAYHLAWSRYRQLSHSDTAHIEVSEALLRLRRILNELLQVSRQLPAAVSRCG